MIGEIFMYTKCLPAEDPFLFFKKARTPGSRCSSLAASAVGIVIAESSQTNVLLCMGPSKGRGGKKEQGDWQLHIGDFFSKLEKKSMIQNGLMGGPFILFRDLGNCSTHMGPSICVHKRA